MFLPSLTTLLGLSAWASTTNAQSDACTMYTVELYESADCGSGTADLPQQVFGGYTNRGCTPFGSSVPIRSALVDVGVIWEVRFTDREDCYCDNVLTCPVTSLPQTDGTRRCIDVEGQGAFYVIDDSVQGLCGGV